MFFRLNQFKQVFIGLAAFVILFIFQPSILDSQPPGGRMRPPGDGTPPPTGTIIGKVIDSETGSPIPRAVVSVLHPTNNTQVAGAYSDRTGSFSINARYGTYKLQVRFIGYDTAFVDNVTISAANSRYDCQTIRLKFSAIEQKEIEIVAQREALEVGLDRRVFNIEQDAANMGASALDVLANIPSVTVDQDDNVSLRGSSNVRIMVDGRMSQFSASETLEQIPASMITSIEVVTNPGARYDADGTAGIINIVTNKQRNAGINGNVNISGGTDDDFNPRGNGSVALNYNTGK
jgi:outer membrane receptor protein involved in Fe transport